MLQVNGTFDWGKLGFPGRPGRLVDGTHGGSTSSLSAVAESRVALPRVFHSTSVYAATKLFIRIPSHLTLASVSWKYTVKTNVVIYFRQWVKNV